MAPIADPRRSRCQPSWQVHERLRSEGRANWLGEATATGAVSQLQDIDRAVARVKALFDDAG